MGCTLLAHSCTLGGFGLPVPGRAAGGVQALADVVVQVQVDGAELLLQLGDGAGADHLAPRPCQWAGLGSPGSSVLAPTLVATTTWSPTPRERRQRPMTRSLSPGVAVHWP
jgi:hypothetical protein